MKVTRQAAQHAALAATLSMVALPVMAQTAVDTALLTIEQPATFYRQMPLLAASIGPALEVADKRKIPDLVKQGETLAKLAFDEKQNLNDIQAALAKTPDAGSVGKDLPAIAAKMREHETVIDNMSLEAAQAAGDKYEATLNARSDKAAIEEISTLMAAPVLAGEVMVTAKRLKWMYETVLLGNPEKLRALPKQDVEQGVGEILMQSRDSKDERPGPFMQQVTMESWRLRRQAVLAQLSTQDVAALKAFYTSAPGRAKRKALVDTFVADNNKAGRSVLTGLMADIR